MALMIKQNSEITVPDADVGEYLNLGYSLIDVSGEVLQAAAPQTLGDWRKYALFLEKRVSELEAQLAKGNTSKASKKATAAV